MKLSTTENIVLKSASPDGLVAMLNAPVYAQLAHSLESKLLIAHTTNGYYLTLLGHELRSELSAPVTPRGL